MAATDDDEFQRIIYNLIARWSDERHDREEDRGATTKEDMQRLTRLIVAAAKVRYGKLIL
jgi:hypothetical protein